MSQDGLLGLLLPLGQLMIGVCLVLVLVVSARRLARRGRSRMGRALVVTGAAAIAIFVLGILLSTR